MNDSNKGASHASEKSSAAGLWLMRLLPWRWRRAGEMTITRPAVARSNVRSAAPRETSRLLKPTEIDIAMMRRAIKLALQAAAIDEVPVGAVVYRGHQVIAEAYNIRESSRDPVGHAELLAVSKAGRALKEWRLTDCSLAVTLEPCPMCAGAVVNARVGRLVYGAADPKAGAVHTLYNITNDKRLNHDVQVIRGVLADECANLLKDFFKRRREANKQQRTAAGA